jgi:hypothetical protein
VFGRPSPAHADGLFPAAKSDAVIDFRRYRARLIIAFALAIALHEVLVGLVRAPAPASDREEVVVMTPLIVRTLRPTPTPAPTPQPTPPPHITPPPLSTPAPLPQIAGRAAGHPAPHRAGGAHRAIAKAAHGQHANPLAAGSGLGSASGTGAGNAPGVGGGRNGTGTGEAGNGNGAVNADTPCGVVEFLPYAAPRYNGTAAEEPVAATVTFADGHKETARFPYPWIYPDGERGDPWSQTNLRNPGFETTLQFPPPGTDRTTLPPLIQYILSHTNAGGYTDLPECPKGRS